MKTGSKRKVYTIKEFTNGDLRIFSPNGHSVALCTSKGSATKIKKALILYDAHLNHTRKSVSFLSKEEIKCEDIVQNNCRYHQGIEQYTLQTKYGFIRENSPALVRKELIKRMKDSYEINKETTQ